MGMPVEFQPAVYRLLTGRLFVFGILLVCTVPLAALSPLLWNDPTTSRRLAVSYAAFFGGFALLSLYGYWFNRRLRRRIDTIPLHTVTGVAQKVTQHFRAPIPVGATTIIGPNLFKMCQFLIIGKRRYTVPLWTDFSAIPSDRPIQLTYVELGGPLIIKLRWIVLAWAPAT